MAKCGKIEVTVRTVFVTNNHISSQKSDTFRRKCTKIRVFFGVARMTKIVGKFLPLRGIIMVILERIGENEVKNVGLSGTNFWNAI